MMGSMAMKIAAAFRFCWFSVTPSSTTFLKVVPEPPSVMTTLFSTCWVVFQINLREKVLVPDGYCVEQTCGRQHSGGKRQEHSGQDLDVACTVHKGSLFQFVGDALQECLGDDEELRVDRAGHDHDPRIIDKAELVVNDILRNDTGIKYPCNDEQGHQRVTMRPSRRRFWANSPILVFIRKKSG